MFKGFNIFNNNKKESGIFIIHGFTGTPTSGFVDLGLKLEANNINFEMPFLQGHHPSEDIMTFNADECLKDIEQKYREFKKKYKRVYLMGYSMGGVIAYDLADRIGADKLVLIAPAFRYGVTEKIVKGVGSIFRRTEKIEIEPEPKEDDILKLLIEDSMSDITVANRKPSISTFRNFTRLVSTINRRLGNIDIPTRIYISEHDNVIPLSSIQFISPYIINKDKRIHILTGIGHGVLSSELKDELVEEIIEFFYPDEKIRRYNRKKVIRNIKRKTNKTTNTIKTKVKGFFNKEEDNVE